MLETCSRVRAACSENKPRPREYATREDCYLGYREKISKKMESHPIAPNDPISHRNKHWKNCVK